MKLGLGRRWGGERGREMRGKNIERKKKKKKGYLSAIKAQQMLLQPMQRNDALSIIRGKRKIHQ